MTKIPAALLCLFLYLSAFASPAEAGPFVDFFRSVKHAFSQPQRKSTHHTTHKTDDAENKPDRPAEKTSASEPPSAHNTRTAERIPGGGNPKLDLPYATPVPGKQGFVTSPFAPDSGYIDVRGVAPGTPVKDPYTGKSFLTP